MKIFISGSISIRTLPELAKEKIENIIRSGYTVLVGDAKGADMLIQKYLLEKSYPCVLVYYAGGHCRCNLGHWPSLQVMPHNMEHGRKLYTLKDALMAEHSDYALMVWDGISKGTLNNIHAMQQLGKKFVIVKNGLYYNMKKEEAKSLPEQLALF